MIVQERQAPQDYFLTLLQTVIGQALDAAGYYLEQTPLQWAGGKYRFAKAFEDGCCGLIDFQVLVHSDNAWSSSQPSRFCVNLGQSGNGAASASDERRLSTRSLGQLVVRDFGVKILPAEDHWWSYHDTDSLAQALAEAGHLIVGYGIPWLAGELLPPSG